MHGTLNKTYLPKRFKLFPILNGNKAKKATFSHDDNNNNKNTNTATIKLKRTPELNLNFYISLIYSNQSWTPKTYTIPFANANEFQCMFTYIFVHYVRWTLSVRCWYARENFSVGYKIRKYTLYNMHPNTIYTYGDDSKFTHSWPLFFFCCCFLVCSFVTLK